MPSMPQLKSRHCKYMCVSFHTGLEVLLTPTSCSDYGYLYFKAEEENIGFPHQKQYFPFYTHQKSNKEGRSRF